MKFSSKLFGLVVLLFIGMILMSCKPETPPAAAPQTGTLVSPPGTPLPVVTSAPTSVSPLPTPPPWAITPEPAATATPPADPLVIYDPVNRFRLRILPGWYVITPDPKAIVAVTSISNYDIVHTDDRPPDGLSIQISIGQLGAEQSFEQWLSDRRALETSPENGSSGVTLTESQPYTLGRYKGVTYTAHDPASSKDVMIVYLLTDDRRIVGIGLSPANVPALSEGLSILSTIEVSPKVP